MVGRIHRQPSGDRFCEGTDAQAVKAPGRVRSLGSGRPDPAGVGGRAILLAAAASVPGGAAGTSAAVLGPRPARCPGW